MSDFQKRRTNWAPEEEGLLKKIFKEKNIQKLLDGKKYRKDSVYSIVRLELAKHGYERTIVQIKQKWQNIKRGTNHHNHHAGNRSASSIKVVNGNSSNAHKEDSTMSSVLLGIGMDTGTMKKSEIPIEEEEEEEDDVIDEDYSQVIPVSPSDFCPASTVDKSKGRGSYGKALNTFHNNWVKSCNNLIRRQEFFSMKQAEKQRQWEADILATQRQHDKELIEMSNAAFQTAINTLIAARKQPTMPYPVQQCKIYPSQSATITLSPTPDETKILSD